MELHPIRLWICQQEAKTRNRSNREQWCRGLVGVEDDGAADILIGEFVDFLSFDLTRIVPILMHDNVFCRPFSKNLRCAFEISTIAATASQFDYAHSLALRQEWYHLDDLRGIKSLFEVLPP